MSQTLFQYNRELSEITCREKDFVVIRSAWEAKMDRLVLI